MPAMILRRQFDSVVVYPSDRASQKETFDTEPQALEFIGENYRGVEVIPRTRGNPPRPRTFRRRQHEPGLTLVYFYAQAIAKKAAEGAK